ncbi:uncharacterized protein LOC116294496 [Actinia tenebrosa]|uniref:Uncharacterized protein LOC116294496 n=1 Tax=Actinia tenebrosa TaxID=6105 RepID=A0A6P8HZD7_ACTTE|nr:uncharacterized protein LOC116294496 [Actinia tenebrosa]
MSGNVGIDELQFYKTQAKRCENLSTPVNMSMKCSATNHVGSICNFTCNEGRSHHMIGSRERTCLPLGLWSGVKPLCGKPKLRLKTPIFNSTQTKGIVEISINGKWSEIAFGRYDITKYTYVARALCRSLGFHDRAIAFVNNLFSNIKSADSWLVLGECTANAQSIDDCSRRSDIARHLVSPLGTTAFLVCGNTTCPVHCLCEEKERTHQIFALIVTCSAPASSHVLKQIPLETTKLFVFFGFI